MIMQPMYRSKMFDVTPREIACFVFAAALHSLLFLWQGGLLTLPEQQAAGLGDMLVAVNFMAEVPNYDAPGGGGGAEKPKNIFARMASILKGQGATEPKAAAPGAAPDSNWMKTEKLVDKSFEAKQGFQGITDKKDALDIAKGQSQEVVMKPSDGNFEKAQPNLKENKFKLAKNDVPFPILKPKTQDALANVNAIPVVVGRTTSESVKSLEGGIGNGPALQSKTFASKGMPTASGFGGMEKASGSSSSGSGGMKIAMGGSGSGAASSGLVGNGGGGYGGSGYGNGGSGGGRGGGNGTGSGTGSGAGTGNGGRAWGGGGGLGSSEMQSLARRSVPLDEAPAGAGGKSGHPGFTITGALANRPIEKKLLPSYEQDARVALRFRVDWSGKVLDGIVVEISSGSPSFDQKVIAALKQWNFSRLPDNRTNEVQEGLVAFVFKGV